MSSSNCNGEERHAYKTTINYFDPFSSEDPNPNPIIEKGSTQQNSESKEKSRIYYFDPFSSEDPNPKPIILKGSTQQNSASTEKSIIYYFDPFSSEPLDPKPVINNRGTAEFRGGKGVHYFDPFSSEPLCPIRSPDSNKNSSVKNITYFDPFSSEPADTNLTVDFETLKGSDHRFQEHMKGLNLKEEKQDKCGSK